MLFLFLRKFFFIFNLFLVFRFWFFRDRVSLYSPGCPGAHFVDQAGLELRNPPASASQSAGITGVHHHCRAENFTLELGVAICTLYISEVGQ